MFGFYDQYFLFFGLKIAYYGFIIAVGMGLGVFFACKNAKFRGLKAEDILLLACYVLPLAIIGARLYYVLFSLDSFHSFVQVLRIWDGGLAVYGGVIGGAVAVGLFCLIHKKNFFDVADVVVPSLLFGQALGRIGCYFSQCCYGIDVTGTKYAWFPLSTMIDGHWHLSTFFYESIWDLIGFIVLLIVLRKSKIRQRGVLLASYFIYYGIGRAWIESLRGDSLYIGSMKVSLLLSLILIVVGIGILIFFFVRNKKVPQMGNAAALREVALKDNKAVNSLGKIKKPKATKQTVALQVERENLPPNNEKNNLNSSKNKGG